MKHTRMRPAEPRDMPSLYELLDEQNRRDGTCYPIPELFDGRGRPAANIPLALVVEHGGKIEGAVIFESRGVEVMLVGCSPRVTLMAQRQQFAIEYTLRGLGFAWIRCLVTKGKHVLGNLKPAMKEMGFRRDDTRFASFFRDLKEKSSEQIAAE